MPHHRFTAAAPLMARKRGNVVNAHGVVGYDRGGGGYRLAGEISDIAAESFLPDTRFPKDFLKPLERHVEANSSDLAERRPGLIIRDGPYLQLWELPHWPQHTLGQHARKFGGLKKAVPAEHLRSCTPRFLVQPVLANPIGPVQPPCAEMNLGDGDTLVQFAVARDWRGEKGRIEHLKCDTSRGDGDAGHLTHLARASRRRQNTKGT